MLTELKVTTIIINALYDLIQKKSNTNENQSILSNNRYIVCLSNKRYKLTIIILSLLDKAKVNLYDKIKNL